MNNYFSKQLKAVLLLTLLVGSLGSALAQFANVWTNPASGRWEVPTNWSAGAPTNYHSIFITNGGTKAVAEDALTSDGTMIVSNILVNSTAGATNRLLLSNALVTLHVYANLELRDHSQLIVDNSRLEFTGPLNV